MSKKSQYTIKERKIKVKGANWQVFQLGAFVDEFFTKKEALNFVDNCECVDGDTASDEQERLRKAVYLLACDDMDEVIAARMKKDKNFAKSVHRAACTLALSQFWHATNEPF